MSSIIKEMNMFVKYLKYFQDYQKSFDFRYLK